MEFSNLLNSFCIHYNQTETAEITTFIKVFTDSYFEIDDTKEGLIFSINEVNYSAKINNPMMKEINILCYEQWFNTLDHSFRRGKSLCDFIINIFSDKVLYISDIKDYLNHSKARKEAKKQIITTIKLLLELSYLRDEIINGLQIKACCFNKNVKPLTIPINALSAFNRPSEIVKDGFRTQDITLNDHNFEYWEYASPQVLII